jgi:hypothetical protein
MPPAPPMSPEYVESPARSSSSVVPSGMLSGWSPLNVFASMVVSGFVGSSSAACSAAPSIRIAPSASVSKMTSFPSMTSQP